MKQKTNFAHISRTVWWLGLIFCFGLTAARAQTVIPTVCFEAKPETFTRALSSPINAGVASDFILNQAAPQGFYSLVINPGGATEERFAYTRHLTGNSFVIAGGLFQSSHAVGETLLLTTEGDAVFGYNNTSGAAVDIPRGTTTNNYFSPANLVYLGQPSIFQPGRHENAFTVKAIAYIPFAWFLNGGQAVSTAASLQACGTITYQGRLSDAGSAANGQFDLQFQAFDALADGIAQSELITLEDVQATNGVFTVPLKFGSTFNNNYNLRFLQIGVRPGTSTGAFTVLTPRQPVTSVPYAVNAQTAQTAATATNSTNATNVSGGFVQLPLTTNAPPASECNAASQYGRQKVDATNNKLWICTATGWKSTVLQ